MAILSTEILMVVCVSVVIAAGLTLAAARLDTMLIQVVRREGRSETIASTATPEPNPCVRKVTALASSHAPF